MRLYSEEWVAAFNEAVAGIEPAEDVSSRDVSFRMLQIVHDGPGGDVRIALSAHEGRVTMERMAREPGDEPAPDVTVSVQFDDAVALARGELDPAGLLAAGRVRVRGDLSVLVRGQSILAAAARQLEPLSERTTP